MPTGRALDTKTSTGGQELVFTDYAGQYIEALRNSAVVLKAGATLLSGLTSNIGLPKQTTAGSASWTGDDPGSPVTSSALATALVTMSPKQLMAQQAFTRMVLQQSTPDVDALVRRDLALVHALAIDTAALFGTGSSNQPKGIVSQSGFQTLTVAADSANGGAPAYADILALEQAVAVSNAMVGPAAYVTNPLVRTKLKSTAKLSGSLPLWDTTGLAVDADGNVGAVNGYRAFVSNQIPSNLTKGSVSSCSALLFGAWDQLLVGEWGAMEIIPMRPRRPQRGWWSLRRCHWSTSTPGIPRRSRVSSMF